MEFIKLNIQMFGASNSAIATLPTANNGSNKGEVYVYFVEGDYTQEDIVNNRTTISISGYFKQTSGYWSQISSPRLRLYWYDTKRGTEDMVAEIPVNSVSRNVPVPIEATFFVEHNEDGSLSGYAKIEWNYGGSSSLVPRTGTATTPLTTLATLPRKNTIVSYDANIGYDCAIDITKKAPTSTTTITYIINGVELGVAVANTSAEGRVWWNVPKSIYNYLTATSSYVEVTLRASTFINGQGIDIYDYPIKVYAYYNDSKPIITLTAKDINGTTINLTGNDQIVVYNASNIQCDYTYAGQYNAYIKSVKLNDVEVGTNSKQTIYYGANVDTFRLDVTDSRDYPNIYSVQMEDRVEYFKPTLNATIERNTPTDGIVNISFNGTFYNGSFGAKHNYKDGYFHVYYRYALKGSSFTEDWIELATEPTDNNFGDILSLEGFDYQKAYTFQIKVVDALNSVVVNQDVSKGRPSPWFDEENMYVDGNYYQRDAQTGKLVKILDKVVESAYLGQNPDINNLRYKNGTYGIYGCAQAPHNDLGTLEVLVYSADWVTQRFNDAYGSVWQRNWIGGSYWSKWKRIKPKSFAQMHTQGYIPTDGNYITSWATSGNISVGDFQCQPEYSRITIPKGSADYVRLCLHLAGYGNAHVVITVYYYDNNGAYTETFRDYVLLQPSGNGYFNQTAYDRVIQVNSDKEQYIAILADGYNGMTFTMNSGFAQTQSFISVEQVE